MRHVSARALMSSAAAHKHFVMTKDMQCLFSAQIACMELQSLRTSARSALSLRQASVMCARKLCCCTEAAAFGLEIRSTIAACRVRMHLSEIQLKSPRH